MPEGLEELSLARNGIANSKQENTVFIFPDPLEDLNLPDSLKILDLTRNSLTNLDALQIPESLALIKLRKNNFARKEKQKIRRRFRKLGIKVRI